MEILQSPWLIELGAFFINLSESNNGKLDEVLNPFSCDLSSSDPVMTLTLPDNVKLEYNLTCAICLEGNFLVKILLVMENTFFCGNPSFNFYHLQELVFKPYALRRGHLFCQLCACSAASVMIFQGLKAADSDSRCPTCREVRYVHTCSIKLLFMCLFIYHFHFIRQY